MEHEVLHPEETASAYYRLLESAFSTDDFYARIRELLNVNPYFFGPHLEILEFLEATGREAERDAFHEFTLVKAAELLLDNERRAIYTQGWTKKEASYLVRAVAASKNANVLELKRHALTLIGRAFYTTLPDEPYAMPRNLVLERSGIPVSVMKKEIAEREVLWLDDTRRQDKLLHHRDTNTMILRAMAHKGEAFAATDGPHESMRTDLAEFFPDTLRFVERFAQEYDAGLGRVALVRLKPHARVYRHYDGEPWLRGRSRFHLVVRSPGGSRMSSGNEERAFKEGDLFFFQNKKMHVARNDSESWRIHVIFDMKTPWGSYQ